MVRKFRVRCLSHAGHKHVFYVLVIFIAFGDRTNIGWGIGIENPYVKVSTFVLIIPKSMLQYYVAILSGNNITSYFF